MTARQLDGVRGRIELCRFGENGEDDGEHCCENKGSRSGETEANRALISRGRRRIPGRRTFASRAGNGPFQAQSGNAPRANFMDMSDREPELQGQSEQCKPRPEAAW